MSEEEHRKIVKKLKKKWLGRMFAYKDGSEKPFIIFDVKVDYRPDRQDMNRLVDSWGNVWFISEIENTDLFVEVKRERRNV